MRYGLLLSGHCVAEVPLPAYEVARFRTGQLRSVADAAGGGLRRRPGRGPEDEIWSAELRPPLRPPSRRLASAYESLVSGSRGEPAVRAEFDFYFYDGALAFLRRPCAEEDTAAKIFLHIYPEAGESLPGDRRRHGFENRDFEFAKYGARFPDGCLAVAPLPDYGIARIRTGQFDSRGGRGELWSAEIVPVERDLDRPIGPARPDARDRRKP